jgi:hypothetical protein
LLTVERRETKERTKKRKAHLKTGSMGVGESVWYLHGGCNGMQRGRCIVSGGAHVIVHKVGHKIGDRITIGDRDGKQIR